MVMLRTYIPTREVFNIQALLMDAGIEADLRVSLDLGDSAPKEVWVPANELARANELIRDFRVEDVSAGADWECQNCQESNPSTFAICWKCNSPAGDYTDPLP